MTFDLTALSWQQLALITVVIAAVDVVVGMVAAIVPPNVFSFAVAATFLQTHVVQRILPIGLLAFLSTQISEPTQHQALWGAACAALALYLLEVLKSLGSTYSVNKALASEGAPANAPATPEELSADLPVEDEPAP